MHRFFVAPEQIAGDRVRFGDEQRRQMRDVLRLRPGDLVTVLDNSGDARRVRLDVVSRSAVKGTVEARAAVETEPAARLTLYQSLLRREKFEWVLQKGTELGVARFVPVVTRRTVARATDGDKLGRWRRIITEAAEQSGRGRLPELLPPQPLAEALRATPGYARTVVPWEAAEGRTLHDALAGTSPGAATALFIGPEGGYDEEEIAAARAAGAIVVTLGPRILRAETAAVVAVALALHALGEMG